MDDLKKRIFETEEANFEKTALEVFYYQFHHVPVYHQFCHLLHRHPQNVKQLCNIPFLPIEFFKSQMILAEEKFASTVFESSGTTGSFPSKHYVADENLYRQSFIRSFERSYGSLTDYVILSLLPSYLERNHSSLVYMATELMRLTQKTESGFFLKEYQELKSRLKALKEKGQKTILLGVTFALLDFADQYPMEFPELIIMETGGMKGRREELTRREVHEQLTRAFKVKTIHSEYGMTELLSQAYSKGNGIFQSPPWMKVMLRDLYDPLQVQPFGAGGAVNVIDLANFYSCSFIATGDAGRVNEDGSFEIMGRLDNAEVRGCNLMVV